MATTEQAGGGRAAAAPIPRRWAIAFWLATLFVAVNQIWAGVTDCLHAQPLFGIVLHLGYPPYFSTMLGIWKLLAAVALLAPRRPLLKEWAYAGLFFDFSAAIVSHAAVRDGVVSFIGPIVSIGALFASWYLRPPPRRLAGVPTRQALAGHDNAIT
jgi:hypothetical protein